MTTPQFLHGRLWEKTEEPQMLKLVKQNKTIPEIATALNRSDGAIIARLKRVVQQMHADGITVDEITKNIKLLSEYEIKKAIEYVPKEKEKRNILSELNKINSSLDMLVKIKLKKNGFKKEDFNNIVVEPKIATEQEITNNIMDELKISDDDIWTKSLLNKMIKYKDDKTKLKELRIEHGISKEDFYEKFHSLVD